MRLEQAARPTGLFVPLHPLRATRRAGIPAALDLVRAADVTVLVIGITKAEEHEGIDRQDTLLPGQQLNFTEQVLATAHAAGHRVVVVSVSGGIVSLDAIAPAADAVVDAFNPASTGPTALAALLFGDANRWGKLPVTIYPSNYTSGPGALPLQDMSFATPPGRSYRCVTDSELIYLGSGVSVLTVQPAHRTRVFLNLPRPLCSQWRGALQNAFARVSGSGWQVLRRPCHVHVRVWAVIHHLFGERVHNGIGCGRRKRRRHVHGDQHWSSRG
jgi:hypothetical protein